MKIKRFRIDFKNGTHDYIDSTEFTFTICGLFFFMGRDRIAFFSGGIDSVKIINP